MNQTQLVQQLYYFLTFHLVERLYISQILCLTFKCMHHMLSLPMQGYNVLALITVST